MAIRLLDPATIGQIAAGEVIERPASVVKELVENALDAGARRIAVRVRGGGLEEVEVADDGAGIPSGEVATALLRHATSKLPEAGGLAAVATLGFRGEGLASVAAVARVTVSSRVAGEEIATAVDAFGEDIGPAYPAPGPLGTRVTVRDLFVNVPARREYLRSPAAEFSRIAQWLSTMALAYPEAGFTLEHDGRRIFAFAPDGDPAPRLRHTFGTPAATMLRVSGARDGVAVDGWISAPGDDRPDRRAQILFVNGRLLRSTLLSGAWSGAYRTFAMTGRYPYGVLFVDVAANEVDPNVHPTKSDVRLRFGERVNAVVRDAMGSALRAAAAARLERSISFAPSEVALAGAAPDWSGTLVDLQGPSHGLRVLAQLDRTFILATDGDAVVLVDQHAAHERVVYEELMANVEHAAPGEPLLVPHVFEVRPDQERALEASRAALVASGLVVEPFGERAFRIVATPAHTTHAGRTRTFDIAEFLDGLDDDGPPDARHAVWASLACHSVARAGDALGHSEMVTLLERLQACANPMHCPHGRPTIVRLEPDAIARLFKRI
ncbi:MAG TPA: DNA mismatch repair endonuclease MutL [Candidatus Lustribacter sp.]|jgi:DNA mismatch repair protein MutL|nr:DNA mismatch repair endonuclease MutL [Candidatus Lustribacter sp.]